MSVESIISPEKQANPKKGMGKSASQPCADRPATSKKVDRLIYLGPSIIEDNADVGGLNIKSGTIFSNGLPENIAGRANSDGHLARLFVPIHNIASAFRSLADEHSILSASKKHVAKTYTKKAGVNHG